MRARYRRWPTAVVAASLALAGWVMSVGAEAPAAGAGEAAEGPPVAEGLTAAERLGWHLAVQAYSFRKFTFFEAVDLTAALGVRSIEAYPGQAVSPEHREQKVGPGLSAELRQAVREKLEAAGVRLVNYGVVGLGADEAAGRQVFEFAREMGIETIVSEPPAEAMDVVEKLADEYGINVAIHNHPTPSRYWDPKRVLAACEGRSRRLGACADTGHWMRSEVQPVEGLKLLEGRIVSLHLKDLDRFGKGAHDVPWGEGQGDVGAMLVELKRQGFRGVISMEYESNPSDPAPDMAKCVAAFGRLAGELATVESNE